MRTDSFTDNRYILNDYGSLFLAVYQAF